MENNFMFPISKIRDSIELNNGRRYYAITTVNSISYHANIKMNSICNGEKVRVTYNDIKCYDIKIKIRDRKPLMYETVYALIGNLLFCYRIYIDSYFQSNKRSDIYIYDYRFKLVQVYKIDEQKFNGLVLIGKEKDTELASKLVGSDYVTELMQVDFESL